ncbi:hypothetical protein [Clostridium intestinale]|jgi:hypothetical protein|uniref:Uncharacterized protein n=2 Tax=Clostridium intestinale TaxID=36845 RepID=U2N090_9CLOT|nr:hypothetical protein [Clostridium intestinale]ERK28912.1 hypothetical protein CINTURNW_3844 [Clostridium intestinale URNW]QLY80253.1 hypothetical protein HZF06_01330 [Clostridium intestinale]
MNRNYTIKSKIVIEVETILGQSIIPTEKMFENLINSDLTQASYLVKDVEILDFDIEKYTENLEKICD